MARQKWFVYAAGSHPKTSLRSRARRWEFPGPSEIEQMVPGAYFFSQKRYILGHYVPTCTILSILYISCIYHFLCTNNFQCGLGHHAWKKSLTSSHFMVLVFMRITLRCVSRPLFIAVHYVNVILYIESQQTLKPSDW